jgi:hypothetical protein
MSFMLESLNSRLFIDEEACLEEEQNLFAKPTTRATKLQDGTPDTLTT